MAKLSISDLDLAGKRALVRVDFNVPLNDRREVTDDTRIRAALPTIRYGIDKGAKVLLLSHLGRPKGTVVPGMSLAPAAARLSELLGKPVRTAPDCIGEAVEAAAATLAPGQLLMLENCRFHDGDEKNDEPRAGAGRPATFANEPSAQPTGRMLHVGVTGWCRCHGRVLMQGARVRRP
jgi:3-phosphoglycerate kinase